KGYDLMSASIMSIESLKESNFGVFSPSAGAGSEGGSSEIDSTQAVCRVRKGKSAGKIAVFQSGGGEQSSTEGSVDAVRLLAEIKQLAEEPTGKLVLTRKTRRKGRRER